MYTNFTSNQGSFSKLNDTGLSSKANSGGVSEFYELEPAVVLDIILDASHPEIKNHTLDVTSWPSNYKGDIPSKSDIDYTWIGKALVRMCFSQQGIAKEKLEWASPLESGGIVEYPLLNEVVVVVKYLDKLYYTKRLNINGFLNNNSDFRLEKIYGNNSGNRKTNVAGEIDNVELDGPISLNSHKTIANKQVQGVLGKRFLSNNKIRFIRKFEGDLAIESRHGQSVRFSTYDNIIENDKGKNIDYTSDKSINKPNEGCGNPMILIRNRQRKLATDKEIQFHPKLPPIPVIKDQEKNVGGYIEEDINNDGSSIHITSGLTVSKWCSTVYKSTFGIEEQSKFSPPNSTKFKFPVLNGEQIIINTDRLILSSRFGETMHFSKKKYSITTDSEVSVDADDQIVLNSNVKTVINSPAIYLGEYDQTNEPALLGQTTADWLYTLCDILLEHTHWYKHTHPQTGGPTPEQTQTIVQAEKLKQLRDTIDTIMSKRVFLTGGGYAAGANGVSPTNTDSGVSPTVINVQTGKGVPGGYKGKNSRKIK